MQHISDFLKLIWAFGQSTRRDRSLVLHENKHLSLNKNVFFSQKTHSMLNIVLDTTVGSIRQNQFQ